MATEAGSPGSRVVIQVPDFFGKWLNCGEEAEGEVDQGIVIRGLGQMDDGKRRLSSNYLEHLHLLAFFSVSSPPVEINASFQRTQTFVNSARAASSASLRCSGAYVFTGIGASCTNHDSLLRACVRVS